MFTCNLTLALLPLLCAACAAAPESGGDEAFGAIRQALEADAEGAAAIQVRLDSLTPGIRDEYFAQPLDPSPLATADGLGAFQFFGGSSGTGAIYSNPSGLVWDASSASWVTGRVTEPIYGAFLLYWLDHGYELALGYPSSPEYAELDDPSSLREQRFGEVVVHASPTSTIAETATLRWNASGGVWAKGYLGRALDGSAPDYTFELESRQEPAWTPPDTVYGAPYPWPRVEVPCSP